MSKKSKEGQPVKTIHDLTDSELGSLNYEVTQEIENRKANVKKRAVVVKYSKKYDGKWVSLRGLYHSEPNGRRLVHVIRVLDVRDEAIHCEINCLIYMSKHKSSAFMNVSTDKDKDFVIPLYDNPRVVAQLDAVRIMTKAKEALLKQLSTIQM